MTERIVTSADGQWAAIRIGRRVTLIDRPPTETPAADTAIDLPTEDVDLAIVVPAGLIAVVRIDHKTRVLLFALPELEAAAAIELEQPLGIVTATGPRLVLGFPGTPQFVIVRAAPRALAAQAIDPGIADFATGMEKNQLVFGLAKKTEVWDAVSGRPTLKLQLPLPPPKRAVGTALGHLFVTRPGSDEVYVYRLSDGRPFRHHAGSPVERAIGHPGSPIVVLVTTRGLVRMNCFAHSLTMIDTPYTPGATLAIHGTGDHVVLLGAGDAGEVWRVPLDSPQPAAPETVPVPAATSLTEVTASSVPALRATTGGPGLARPHPAHTPNLVPRHQIRWRDPLVTGAHQLARGEGCELVVPDDSELAEIAGRLGLAPPARRALHILYALYLIGEAPSLATLAALLEDWSEPLGQGELANLGLVERHGGRVALRPALAHALDGGRPQRIRIAGSATPTVRGAVQIAREGRSDAAIEAWLAEHSRIAIILDDHTTDALLEAWLHDATAVALGAPAFRPVPWPRDASLIVVTDETSPRWATELASGPGFPG